MLYKTDVNKQAKYHGLPVSLIYAVMEVESSFNPRAQSPIPAFGLMQIVPTTAGLDVNRHLRKSSEAPSANELYQPPQNVLYGATYLAMLYQTYFKDIKNPLSKHYCVIAAYNTGMGNVSALFSRDGTKDLKKAANVINKLSAQQVHDKIKSRAHPETKRYITKVLDAQHYFEQNM
nr:MULTISPECIES: transglycosylase SLT domain-containing protein [unclassified Psychrosphaera]